MLRGQFEVTIDDKGRLVMPSRCQSAFALPQDEQDLKAEQEIEEALEKAAEDKEVAQLKAAEGKKIKGRLVIVPDVHSVDMNADTRLLIYPLDQWEEEEQDWEARSAEDKEREDKETLLGLVAFVDLDAKGRFALPGYLLEHIGLNVKELSKNKFCLIGKKNRLELWQKELWDKEYLRANAAMKQRREDIIRLEQDKEANTRITDQVAKKLADEAIKEFTEEGAGKEAIKQAMKEALKNKVLEEMVQKLLI